MIRRLKLLVPALLLVILSMPVSVLAQSENEAIEAEPLMTTQAQEEDEEEAGDDKAAGREARVKAYKEKKTEKLSQAQSRRVAQRCNAAQGKVTSLRARVNQAVANRKKVYQEIGTKLDTLLERLKAAELDTTVLETAREDMRAELVVLTESLDSYDTVLTDLMAMDCEADPETFSAALEAARELQNELRDQARAFRQFATTELRSILQDLRSQLASQNEEETTTESSETTEDGEETN